MAATITLYNSFKGDLGNGNIDWNSDTIYLLLTTSSYTPDIDTHTKRSDVTNEVSGTGYSTGGAQIANCSVTVDTTNDLAKYDGDDVSWASSTITARYGVIYKYRGGASSADELVGFVDFSADVTSTGGTFTVSWNASGIFTAA